ncbi:LOW QUALITY PROTEIN: SUMO-activating enzyme subunit 2-like [Pollicipes pollicipes]|uniref:LOW QUALITY PROTEIN: SUMO-activating enzyme subunit 2-like n=1 Tax=Pollicipes pollicipes TaxID=41117 RepID=UPI0018858524|nr:LOW QUALITY PROTEIN: SUMO-activating enzyme subunit 2-like [Pollicipes pollicipes]
MARPVDILPENLRKSVTEAKLLLVGAGGIGCEVLKNLVLSGFQTVEVIDLDTIDVSNLNRQFLFQRQHVGKPKSKVACEAALGFNPSVSLKAHHDSIMKPEYGVNFFKGFTLVLNALDNRAARSHVNRLCLAAQVPLVESGTAGYLGQVTVIKRGATECYECQPKPAQKTFPGCTIRNTPSEPIHCIVWAKHLFNQLFGEADPDEDVSPDTADPELAGEAAATAALSEPARADGNVERVSTRAWAAQSDYEPRKLFRKLFHDDIQYLLTMDKLWTKRRPPTPLVWDTLPDAVAGSSSGSGGGADSGLADQRLWAPAECAAVLQRSVASLRLQLRQRPDGGHLLWDKDDADAMDFVAACANLRAHCFGIALNTRFTIKSMAGNIIPAIATTNAIIAAMVVFEAYKLLEDRFKECKTVYLNRQPNARRRLLVPCELVKPNPKCYVCAEKPEVSVRLDVTQMTARALEERVLKAALSMVAPDAELLDGRGTILLSSEAGETDATAGRTLAELGVADGARLRCDDFLQNYELIVNVVHCTDLEEGQEFEVVGDPDQLRPSDAAEPAPSASTSASANGGSGGAGLPAEQVDDDDDLVCLSNDEEEEEDGRLADGKRSASSDLATPPAKKRRALEGSPDPAEPDVIEL